MDTFYCRRLKYITDVADFFMIFREKDTDIRFFITKSLFDHIYGGYIIGNNSCLIFKDLKINKIENIIDIDPTWQIQSATKILNLGVGSPCNPKHYDIEQRNDQ